MNKSNHNIIIAILIFLNIFTLFKINSLENYIDRSLQDKDYAIRSLQNDISSIYSNVDSRLEKQASILDTYNINFGDELNSDKLTVPVDVTIIPKEFKDNLTAALEFNGKTVPMKNDGITFAATVDIYIFDSFDLVIVLEQDGIKRTETLESYGDIQYKYLLGVKSGLNGNESYQSGKYKFDGEIKLIIDGPSSNFSKKLSIIKDLNGAVIEEEQIEDVYKEIDIEVNDEVEMFAGDKYTVYALVQDKYGLSYKYIITTYEIDKDGKSVNSYPEWTNGSILEIKDKSGKLVFKSDY